MPIVAKPRLPAGRAWEKLIQKWGYLLDEYERLASADGAPDVAYWHHENTITGLLTTAAWQIGGAGIVQFSTGRVYEAPEESGIGFGDAWIGVGERWYTVEAKLCWRPADIDSFLKLAAAQLETLPPESYQNTERLAVCYCVPCRSQRTTGIPATKLAEDVARRRRDADLVVAYEAVGAPPSHRARLASLASRERGC
jgi:hypothetical protein